MSFAHRIALLAALSSSLLALPAYSADVGVSISVGQPGFYGRIDIGDFQQPVLMYPQPVVIQPAPVPRSPIYLHVPPGHAKYWGKHCRRYNACNQPVYFVSDNWYSNVYVPEYKKRHGPPPRKDRHEGRGRDQDRGHGPGKGHDHKDKKGHRD